MQAARPRQPRQRRLLRPVLWSLPEAQAPCAQAARALRRCGFVMATQQRPFHLVVFGASGFTGQFVTEEVAREQVSPERTTSALGRGGPFPGRLLRVLEGAAVRLGKGGRLGRPGTLGSAPPPRLSPHEPLSPAEGFRRLQ